MLFFKVAALAFAALAVSNGAPTPQVKADKQGAVHRPACVIPMGQIIDVKDIPRRMILTDWMKRLDGHLPLSLISLPATHDAGTAQGLTGWTRCQTLTLPAQMTVGVRGFDIRLRLVEKDLLVYHGEEPQNLKFADVLKSCQTFLSKHPTEVLVMRVREESKAIRSSESFEAAFERLRSVGEYRRLFYRSNARTDIPTLDETRGKIVLLDNYGKLDGAIDYPNPTMGVQDDYDTSDMDGKFREVIAKFQDALNQRDGKVWNVNYTSSSTIQVDQLANAVKINPQVSSFLSGRRGHLGLVFVNFLGPIIVREIVESNF